MAAGDVHRTTKKRNSKKAIVGDGTGDYVQIDAWGVAREAAGTADTVGTLAGWINVNIVAGTIHTVISAGDTNALEGLWLSVVNGLVHAELADGGAVAWEEESDAIHITTDGWHHIAVVQNGTSPVLYHNGVLVASTTDTSVDETKWFVDLNGIDNSNIGTLDYNTAGTANDIDGAIGQVKHWNLALTAADIMKDYQGETARQAVTDALISSWDWDEDLVDSVSAHNGTLVNQAYLDPAWDDITSWIHVKRALGGVTDLMEIDNDGHGNITVTYIENT